MIHFTVDEKRCTRCGQCAHDCPAGIIEQEGEALPLISPDQEEECIQCQHCLAVCPSGAVSVLGRKPADSLPLSHESFPRFEQMARFVRGRRSVRHYRNQNVDPALIKQLLAALANAPSGVNRRELTFRVIDDKGVMQRFREKVYAGFTAANAAGCVPERFSYLKDLIKESVDHQTDIILRGAPHALVVSAPPDAPCPNQDVTLALAYFELLAQSAGLGTVWCGLLWMVLETLPELKADFGLAADHVHYAMLFGYPAVRYARTVQRDDAARVHRVLL